MNGQTKAIVYGAIYLVLLLIGFVYNHRQGCDWREQLFFTPAWASMWMGMILLIMGEVEGTPCPRICE